MYNKKQIKAIIDVIKNTDRPVLKRVFEQGGYLWATNGYVALELGEVRDTIKGKQIPLQALVGWYGTHKTNDITTLTDLVEPSDTPAPDMVKLLHHEYIEPTEIMLNVSLLDTACKFLGVDKVSFEQNPQNSNCYRVKPLEDMPGMSEALDIKAYVMGLTK